MEAYSEQDKKSYTKLLSQELRQDGRKYMENRKIAIIFGNEPGNVEAKIGNTHIITKTTAEIVEPKKNKPTEGFLKFKVDFSVLAEEDEKSSQQARQYATEISKLLERIIKESKAIDVESLCLISGKRVWSINVDVCVVNNDGNLIDSSYISVITSLLHFRKPFVSVESQDKIKIYESSEKNPQPLSIHHIPIAFTFCLFNHGKVVLCDPVRIEEAIMDGRITITMNIYKDICSIHKPGGAPIDPQILSIMVQAATVKVAQMTKFIRDILKNTEYNNLDTLKNQNQVIVMEFPTFENYIAFQEQNQKQQEQQQLQQQMEEENQQQQQQQKQIENQQKQEKIDIEEVEQQIKNRDNI